jgi:outer membrane receptor protein involved in Fe transport
MNAISMAVLMAGAGMVSAQQLVLEEVIVTAQLRTESLQDVPISVNAVSGTKMFEAGIDKIEDLQAYVPNLTMSETGIGTNIYVRGIGSGINQGFEQSVGMYVDGVYHGRAQLSRAPFLDLERVEVLRGPQNILYGKNSIAGALSVITAKPTDVFEGQVSVLYEPEHDEQVYDLMLSGPLSDTVSGRLAYRKRTMDGYIDNVTTGKDEPERDEETVRLILAWAASDRLDATLKYEHNSFDVTGRQIEIITDRPSLNPGLGGANWSGLLASLGASPSILDTRQDFKRTSNGDYSDNTTDNLTLSVNYALGEHTVTYTGAYLEYDYRELCDCDFTGAVLFDLLSEEDYKQSSHEIRLTSPVGNTIEYIAGAYYQDSELSFNDRFRVPPGSLIPVLGAALPPLAPLQTLNQIAVPREFTSDSELFSLFAQVTWNVTDRLHLTAGGRWSDEEKKGTRNLVVTDLNGNVIPAGAAPALDATLAGLLNTYRHDLSGKRNEDKFSPSLLAEYDLNDDVMLYATWSKGFKSGGFDARSNSAPGSPVPVPGSFAYDDEQATSYEVGSKMVLFGGRAELNAALFFTEYEDLQVSIFDGVLGFNVGNAAKAETLGAELDGRWMVTEWFTLSGSLAYLDFEFKDYPNGQCTQLQRIQTGQPLCDYDGKTNQYVAEWSGTLSGDVRFAIADSLEFRGTLDLIYSDDYNPSQNLDPIVAQDAYVKVNARLAVGANDGMWEVALVGRNLTDKEIITYANDVPLASNLTQSIGHYAFVERERSVAIQGIYRF